MHNYYNNTESFKAKDGLMFAIAMAGYDGTRPFIAEEDPSIGILEFVLNSYNASDSSD